MIEITRRSMVSGKTHTRSLDITQEQLDRFNRGQLVQLAFPHLSADDREFILSGITPEEWAAMMTDEDAKKGDEDEKDDENDENDDE